MKKIFVLSLLISIGVFCHSQVDTISTNIFQKDGKLGIGTDQPRTRVHIQDTSSQLYLGYQPAYDGPYINLLGEATGETPMISLGLAQKDYYYNENLLAKKHWGYVYGNDLNEGIAILPRMAFAPAGLYVTRDGLVGINTSEPIEKLDINGGLKIGNTENSNSGTIRWTGTDFEGYDGLGWKSFTTGSGSGESYWNANGNDLYYTNGRIGIGTDAPDNSLSITGSEDTWPGRFFIHVNNTSTSETSAAYMRIQSGPTESATALGHISSTYTMNDDYAAIADYGRLTSSGPGLIIDATKQSGEAGIIKFTSGTSPGTTLTEHMRIVPGGNIGIGIKEPVEKLDINGGLKIGNTENSNSGTIRWTGTDFEGYDGLGWKSFTTGSGSGESYWNANGNDLYYTNGRIGIGTDAPDNSLSITGSEDAWPGRFFIHILNTSTSETSAAYMRIQSGPTESATALGHISSTYTMNDDYAAIADYGRLTSSGPGLIIDATKQSGEAGIIKFTSGTSQGTTLTEHMRIIPGGNVGIGTKEPIEKLDISGGLRIGNTENNNSGTIRWTGIDFEGFDGSNWRSFTGESGSGEGYWNANGSDIFFSSGNVGIGTSSPNAKLEVADGDIYISDIEKGIIMKSPDGSCWRGTVDNSGSLNFVKIDCPGNSSIGIIENTEQDTSTIVKIFPNPTDNNISVQINDDNLNLILKIYSIEGKLVEKRALSSNRSEINISKYSSGEYLFITEDKMGNFISSTKVIKE